MLEYFNKYMGWIRICWGFVTGWNKNKAKAHKSITSKGDNNKHFLAEGNVIDNAISTEQSTHTCADYFWRRT